MSKTALRLKFAKMLLRFATVETAEGVLYLEGELAEGAEVFTEDAEGNMVPAADGEYHIEGKVIAVSEGKVVSITDETANQEQENMEAETEAQKPAYDEAVMALVDEIDALKADRDSLKSEIEALKADIQAIRDAMTSQTAEEQFSKQEQEKKPVWQKR